MLRLGICKFKYEPSFWKVWGGDNHRWCDKPVEITGKSDYCEEHGCRVCGYVNLKGEFQNSPLDIKLDPELGEESVCSLDCKKKEDTKYFWEQKDKKAQEQAYLWTKIKNSNDELDDEIKNIFLPFYNIVGGDRINSLKLQLIKEEIDTEKFAEDCRKIIDSYSLVNEEKDQWEKIYKTNNSANLQEKLLSFARQERDYLVSLAKKYRDLQEQKNTPECKKCKLRREQPNTWPAGCEGWCKECVEQNQREKQTPNNNDNYQPPINNSPPTDNQENFPQPKNDSAESANSQTEERDKREREQATRGGNLPPPEKQNNLQPEAKKPDRTSLYLVSGIVGIVIVAAGISLVIAAKRKRKNGRRYQK